MTLAVTLRDIGVALAMTLPTTPDTPRSEGTGSIYSIVVAAAAACNVAGKLLALGP